MSARTIARTIIGSSLIASGIGLFGLGLASAADAAPSAPQPTGYSAYTCYDYATQIFYTCY
jgi:hypothetical protein